ELLEITEVGAVIPRRVGNLIGPALPSESITQVVEDRVGNVDAERSYIVRCHGETLLRRRRRGRRRLRRRRWRSRRWCCRWRHGRWRPSRRARRCAVRRTVSVAVAQTARGGLHGVALRPEPDQSHDERGDAAEEREI